MTAASRSRRHLAVQPDYYEMRDFFEMYYMPGGTNGVDENGNQIIIDDWGERFSKMDHRADVSARFSYFLRRTCRRRKWLKHLFAPAGRKNPTR